MRIPVLEVPVDGDHGRPYMFQDKVWGSNLLKNRVASGPMGPSARLELSPALQSPGEYSIGSSLLSCQSMQLNQNTQLHSQGRPG